jgi:hypothetical protein
MLGCGAGIGFARSSIARLRRRGHICWRWFRNRRVVRIRCRKGSMAPRRLWNP